MATLLELLFRANTSELDTAEQKLGKVSNAATKVQTEANNATKALDGMKAGTPAVSATDAAISKLAQSTLLTTAAQKLLQSELRNADGHLRNVGVSANDAGANVDKFSHAFDALKEIGGPIGALAGHLENIARAAAKNKVESAALNKEITSTSQIYSGQGPMLLAQVAALAQSTDGVIKYGKANEIAKGQLTSFIAAQEKAQEMERAYKEKIDLSGVRRAQAGSDLALTRAAERQAIADTRKEAYQALSAGPIKEAITEADRFGAVARTAYISVAAAAATVVAATMAIAFSAREAADANDEMAQKMGITTAELATMKLVANENGGSVEGLVRMYDKLSKSMNKMDEDNAKTEYAFQSLGLAQKDLADKSKEEVAGTLVKNWQALGMNTKATAGIIQLLGPAFRDQIPSILATADSLDEYKKRTEDTAASEELVKQAGRQEKAVSDLGLSFTRLRNQIGVSTGEGLTDIIAFASGAIKSLTDSGIVVGFVKTVWQTLAVVLSDVAFVFRGVGTEIGGIAAQIASILSTGKFEGAAKIRSMMIEDGKQARAELDAWQAKVMGTAAPEKSNNSSAEDARLARLNAERLAKIQGKATLAKTPSAVPAEKESPTDRYIDQQAKSLVRLGQALAGVYGIQSETNVQTAEAEIASKKFQEALAKLSKAEQTRTLATVRSQAVAMDAMEAEKKLAEVRERSKDAIEKAQQSSKAEVDENRIRIQVLGTYGKTMDDVNVAIAANRLATAEDAYATGLLNGVSEEKLIKLREEVELLRAKNAATGAVAQQNKDAEGPQTGIEGFTNGWTKAFTEYKKNAQTTADIGKNAFTSATTSMGDALATFVTTGKLNFKSLAASILADMAKIAAQRAVMQIFSMVVGAFSGGSSGGTAVNGSAGTVDMGSFAAKGAWFNGPTSYFANGDVFNSPTSFAFGNGRKGVMGEAGPEAIMPLTRGSNGKLGVVATGGSSPINITNNMTVSIGTVDSNERKEELLREIGKMVVATTKGTMANEMRQGGMLNRKFA
jgi:lambda family phage tail tape measure protein